MNNKNSRFSVLLIVLLFVASGDAWFENCDKQTVLTATISTATISSPIYANGNYAPGSSCRYRIQAPSGYTITASCTLKIYSDQYGKCNNEYFYVMKDGSTEILGSEFSCGSGTISRTSTSNLLTLAYTSGTYNVGQFYCSISMTLKQSQNSDVNTCNCGWGVTRKIVGGSDAKANQYISMVGLVDIASQQLFCGASIISSYYILSAAHCFSSTYIANASKVGALVGDHDYTVGTDTSYAALYTAKDIFRHESFNSQTNANDIALVKTSSEIKFNNGVGPACLPFAFEKNAFDKDVFVEAPGWGTTSFAGKTSSVLKTVTLQTYDINECNKNYKTLNTGQICTYTPRKDTCQLDSGGSLYYRYNRLYTVGIISFGADGCGTKPSVNTKVTTYLSWIQSKAVGATFCNV